MNDPNGLIYHDGWYHMYYQFYPDDINHGPMHWGHARSRDFLCWENLPVALYPDELGVIFSGSMVYDEKTPRRLQRTGPPLSWRYLHTTRGNGEEYRETQSLAYSFDGGLTFDKFEGNPVLDMDMRDFRDPKVIWHEGKSVG
jgi:fructan beta-fructosidase